MRKEERKEGRNEKEGKKKEKGENEILNLKKINTKHITYHSKIVDVLLLFLFATIVST
jgi:hypothetical protein